jgi:hypothetical protein
MEQQWKLRHLDLWTAPPWTTHYSLRQRNNHATTSSSCNFVSVSVMLLPVNQVQIIFFRFASLMHFISHLQGSIVQLAKVQCFWLTHLKIEMCMVWTLKMQDINLKTDPDRHGQLYQWNSSLYCTQKLGYLVQPWTHVTTSIPLRKLFKTFENLWNQHIYQSEIECRIG